MSFESVAGYNTFPIPVATISAYGGKSAPAGWLNCDGSSYSNVDYPGLFAVIGYKYGGSGNSFNVPNMTQYYYIQGANLANAGTTQNGSIQPANSVTLAAGDLPTLPASSFTHTFNISGQTPNTYQLPVSYINCNQSQLGTVFGGLNQGGTTTTASFTLGGTIPYTNNSQTPLISNTTPTNADVKITSLPFIYIIKTEDFLPPVYTQPPTPFQPVNDWYLQNHTPSATTLWNSQISGFINTNSNYTPI